MQSDPTSDFLTRVRNALAAEHSEVEIPASKLKKELARILKEQGYISDYSVVPTTVGESVKVVLKYTGDGEPAIEGVRRVSRPGRRHYVNANDVPRVRGGMGTAIVSTSSGVMTGHEATEKGIGGEVVAYVW